MAAQTFQPHRCTLTLGNGNVVTWLRLTVQPADAGEWVPLLQPTLVQDARVYTSRVAVKYWPVTAAVPMEHLRVVIIEGTRG